MAVFILTQNEENMVPPGQNTLESHSTEFFPVRSVNNAVRQRLSDDDSTKESENVVDVNAEVLRMVNARYPYTKACLHDLPLYLFAFLYMTGLMRCSYFFARLNEQLDFAFDKDKAVVKHLLETSAAISMCGFFLSPITGFILDISRRAYRRRLKRRLNDPDLRLTDAEIYWTHLRALTQALYVLATSTTTTDVMIAFPVTQFGVTIAIVTLVSGVFITLQYGLLEMPIRAANGVLVAISWVTVQISHSVST
ncbi:uncharacterized protein DEA37_0007870 [Paragonimus westermani]|uniref:Uncharacterized protein n=1 Tax=Paragonimus westermani TaxID=34504 RepID=A0A5J4N971_9TREM|nr:uncharacterized protein DEA37_0007870 [Paragonimus westermani]